MLPLVTTLLIQKLLRFSSSMSYAKIISFEVKSELHTKTERTFYENLYSFCNSFNLEDDCFVHNSVVSFLPHQNAKYPPQNYPTKQGAKKQ